MAVEEEPASPAIVTGCPALNTLQVSVAAAGEQLEVTNGFGPAVVMVTATAMLFKRGAQFTERPGVDVSSTVIVSGCVLVYELWPGELAVNKIKYVPVPIDKKLGLEFAPANPGTFTVFPFLVTLQVYCAPCGKQFPLISGFAEAEVRVKLVSEPLMRGVHCTFGTTGGSPAFTTTVNGVELCQCADPEDVA